MRASAKATVVVPHSLETGDVLLQEAVVPTQPSTGRGWALLKNVFQTFRPAAIVQVAAYCCSLALPCAADLRRQQISMQFYCLHVGSSTHESVSPELCLLHPPRGKA